MRTRDKRRVVRMFLGGMHIWMVVDECARKGIRPSKGLEMCVGAVEEILRWAMREREVKR